MSRYARLPFSLTSTFWPGFAGRYRLVFDLIEGAADSAPFGWQAVAPVPGTSGLHFHDLRGSGATWAAAAGATVREGMDGSLTPRPPSRVRYQHATQERDRAIADKLGVLMRTAAFSTPAKAVVTVVPVDR